MRQHRVAQVDVFRDRLTGKSADFNQTIAAHDERGADAKRASPGVLSGLKDIEEEPLVVHHALRGQQIVLDRIAVVVELRRLNDRHARVRQQADRSFQQISLRREVCVQNKNDRRIGRGGRHREGVVEIAGLRRLVVHPRDISRASLQAVVAKPASPRVVEHPDGEIRIIEFECRQDGALDHLKRLVIGADEDIDRGIGAADAHFALGPIGLSGSIDTAEQNDDRHQRVDDRDEFEREEQVGPKAFGGHRKPRQGVVPTPEDIDDKQ